MKACLVRKCLAKYLDHLLPDDVNEQLLFVADGVDSRFPKVALLGVGRGGLCFRWKQRNRVEQLGDVSWNDMTSRV